MQRLKELDTLNKLIQEGQDIEDTYSSVFLEISLARVYRWQEKVVAFVSVLDDKKDYYELIKKKERISYQTKIVDLKELLDFLDKLKKSWTSELEKLITTSHRKTYKPKTKIESPKTHPPKISYPHLRRMFDCYFDQDCDSVEQALEEYLQEPKDEVLLPTFQELTDLLDRQLSEPELSRLLHGPLGLGPVMPSYTAWLARLKVKIGQYLGA